MPQNHNRKSIRLQGYDYSSKGLYFITICTQKRIHQFGEIVNGEMVLNENGEIALRELQNTEIIRKGNVMLHSYIVMPNHVHFIIQIIPACRGVPRTPWWISRIMWAYAIRPYGRRRIMWVQLFVDINVLFRKKLDFRYGNAIITNI